jgi:hypothetical protein
MSNRQTELFCRFDKIAFKKISPLHRILYSVSFPAIGSTVTENTGSESPCQGSGTPLPLLIYRALPADQFTAHQSVKGIPTSRQAYLKSMRSLQAGDVEADIRAEKGLMQVQVIL